MRAEKNFIQSCKKDLTYRFGTGKMARGTPYKHRRRTTTGAAAPKSPKGQALRRWCRVPRGTGGALGRRLVLDDAPRCAVDFAVGHAFFLRETLREDLRLDASIRERSVVFDETPVTGAKAVSVFRARSDVASGRDPALRASESLILLLRELGLTSESPEVKSLERSSQHRTLATQSAVSVTHHAKVKARIICTDHSDAMLCNISP